MVYTRAALPEMLYHTFHLGRPLRELEALFEEKKISAAFLLPDYSKQFAAILADKYTTVCEHDGMGFWVPKN